MFRYKAVIFGGLLCSVVLTGRTSAFDVTSKKVEYISLTEKDIVPKEELDVKLRDGGEVKFIGDLEIGARREGEIVFRRLIEVSNPTQHVYRSVLTVHADGGIIHYLNVVNGVNSYAVVCDIPNTLGTSETSFSVRVPPNKQSRLWIFAAAHTK